MGLLSSLLERRVHPANPDDFLINLFGGGESASGRSVSDTTALQSTAVLACVRVLSETIASLPLIMYRRLPRGKQRDPGHPLHRVLHDSPNPELTSFEFREAMMGWLGIRGNAYASIVWNGAGDVAELWPLPATLVRVERMDNGKLIYFVQTRDAGEVPVRQADMLHIRALSSEGVLGYSPITMAREAIGLSLAAEEYGGRFFSNNAAPRGFLETPHKLGDDGRKRLREGWEAAHGGLEKSHRVAVLEEGMKWAAVGLSQEDAQFIQTRKFQVTEIARVYRMPPHMIGDLERATFSNVEQQAIDFVVHTIRPWLVRWEQAYHRALFTERDRGSHFAEHLVDGLLRGDAAARHATYALGRTWGYYSANDVRALENRNPIEGGDVYLVPMNMVPAPRAAQSAASFRAVTEERGATNRRRIARSFLDVFSDNAARIIRRERDEVLKAARRMLKQRALKEFVDFLEGFYLRESGWIGERMAPPFRTLGETARDAAAGEVGVDPAEVDLDEFLGGYETAFAQRHAGSSMGQLREVVERAEEGDRLAVIEARLDEWAATRPAKIAMRETVQLTNAIATTVFVSAGVSRLKWRAFGKNCPYCDAMNGKVVGVQENFFEGGEFKPDGVDKPITVRRPKRHPPLHQGCDCVIVPA